MLLISAGILQEGHGAPVVSEFLASNRDSLSDEDGDSSDWIEIHNPALTPLDLSGFTLSDDPELPQKWALPTGTSLLANGRLVIFASGKDRTTGTRLHTNFVLSASSGSLILSDPAGAFISGYLDYPKQRRDISYGTNGVDPSGYFSPATPGALNANLLVGFVADTVFSKKRGFYDGFFVAEISSATPEASIRYTFDGSKPSPTRGIVYTGSFLVTSSTVVRAIAYKENLVPTNVDAQSYLFTGDIINQTEMNPAITDSFTYRNEIEDALKALPVVSLSFEEDSVFGPTGIYENPNLKGRGSEREIHFEYFDPSDPSDSIHEPAGMRIHGGNSREHPKKPLRIYFRDDYGDSRLEHDLFPDSRVRSFKSILLRGGGHDAWTFDRRWDEATFIRNQFLHQLQRDMGQTSPHGRHVNVFLNGQYWGLYELQEFPHEHYNADHHGGDPADWDVVKHGQEVEAGDGLAWEGLIALARNGIASTEQYEAIQEYLDLENFADAMIQRIWASDEDWLSPFYLDGLDVSTFLDDKNWYVARKSRNGTSKFFFYNWDAEMSMGIPFSGVRTFENDFSQVANSQSPGFIYDALRRYPEFQLFFADRLQKHFFYGGTFTTEPLSKVWDRYTETVRSPVVAESARWGVQAWLELDRPFPFTRNQEWLPAVAWVRNQFIPNRTRVVLDQFRSVGLYPGLNAPIVTPFLNLSATPIEIRVTSDTEEGTIYYTTDGSDPRTPGETSQLILVGENSPLRALIPDALIDRQIGFSWRGVADPSNIDDWISGTNGVGFERGNGEGYRPFISTPLDAMWDTNATVYLRYQFAIPDQAALESISSLILQMRFDDGFGAYLNGSLVAWENLGEATWDATASAANSDPDAVRFEPFDLSAQIGQLQVGRNVLAIHGQNRSIRSSDFLIEASLSSSTESPASVSAAARPYDGALPIHRSTLIKSRVLAETGQWSALNEIYYTIANSASSQNLLVSEIHYHPSDATSPEELAASTNKDDYEFLELFNTSTIVLDLSDCTFDRGLTFTFPQGSSIGPRSRALIVSNRSAFIARYGSGLNDLILGEFERGSNLSNGGETLSLLTPGGDLIFTFSYNDKAPWPIAPDGMGPSLVLLQADTPPASLGQAASWRPSNLSAGSPGQPEDISFTEWAEQNYGTSTKPGTRPADIAPGETESNLIRYSQGSDLNRGPLWSSSVVSGGDGPRQTFTYQARTSLAHVSLVPEISDDLINWEPKAITLARIPQVDGISLITIRAPDPPLPGQRRFFRLSAIITP